MVKKKEPSVVMRKLGIEEIAQLRLKIKRREPVELKDREILITAGDQVGKGRFEAVKLRRKEEETNSEDEASPAKQASSRGTKGRLILRTPSDDDSDDGYDPTWSSPTRKRKRLSLISLKRKSKRRETSPRRLLQRKGVRTCPSPTASLRMVTLVPCNYQISSPLPAEGLDPVQCVEVASKTHARKSLSSYSAQGCGFAISEKDLSDISTSATAASSTDDDDEPRTKGKTRSIIDTTSPENTDQPATSRFIFKSEEDKVKEILTRTQRITSMTGRSIIEIAQALPWPAPDPEPFFTREQVRKEYEEEKAKHMKILGNLERRYCSRIKVLDLQSEAYANYTKTYPSLSGKRKESPHGRLLSSKSNPHRFQHLCPLDFCFGTFFYPKRHLENVHGMDIISPDLRKRYLELCDENKAAKIAALEKLPDDYAGYKVKIEGMELVIGSNNVTFMRELLRGRKKSLRALEPNGGKIESSLLGKGKDTTTRSKRIPSRCPITPQERKKIGRYPPTINIRRCPDCNIRVTHVAMHLRRKHKQLPVSAQELLRKKILSSFEGKQKISFRGDMRPREKRLVEEEASPSPSSPTDDRKRYQKKAEKDRKFDLYLSSIGPTFQSLIRGFVADVKIREKNWNQTLNLFIRLLGRLRLEEELRKGVVQKYIHLSTVANLCQMFAINPEVNEPHGDDSGDEVEVPNKEDEAPPQNSSDDELQDEFLRRPPEHKSTAVMMSHEQQGSSTAGFRPGVRYMVTSMRKAVGTLKKFVRFCLRRRDLSQLLFSFEDLQAMQYGTTVNSELLAREIRVTETAAQITPYGTIKGMVPIDQIMKVRLSSSLREMLKKSEGLQQRPTTLTEVGGKELCGLIRDGFITLMTLSTFRRSKEIVEITNRQIENALCDYRRAVARGQAPFDEANELRFLVIPIRVHKTTSSGHSDMYVLDGSLEPALRAYLRNVRPFFKRSGEPLQLIREAPAFPNQWGIQMSLPGVVKSVRRIWEYVHGAGNKYTSLISPRSCRKSIIKAVLRELPEEVESLALMMGHNPKTARKHYDVSRIFSTRKLLSIVNRRFGTNLTLEGLRAGMLGDETEDNIQEEQYEKQEGLQEEQQREQLQERENDQEEMTEGADDLFEVLNEQFVPTAPYAEQEEETPVLSTAPSCSAQERTRLEQLPEEDVEDDHCSHRSDTLPPADASVQEKVKWLCERRRGQQVTVECVRTILTKIQRKYNNQRIQAFINKFSAQN